MIPVSSSDQLLQHTGQGDAGVLTPINFGPLQHALMMGHADKLVREKAIADRDAKLADQLKYNPKEIAAPYQAEQQAKYEQLLNQRANILRNHYYDPAHPERQKYDAMINEMEQNAQRGKDAMASYGNVSSAIKADKYLKQEQAQSTVNDLLHDENGTSRLPINQVNPQQFQNVLNDPQHFNGDAYASDVQKLIPEQLKQHLETQKLYGGQRENEAVTKGKFINYDPETGEALKNPDGSYQIAITPETKHVFYNHDPRAKRWVENEVEKHNNDPANKDNQITEDQVIQKVLSPYAYANTLKKTGTLVRPYQSSTSGQTKVEDASKRYQSVRAMIAGDQTELGNLGGATYLGHRVENIDVSRKPVEIIVHTKDTKNPETGEVKKGVDKKEYHHQLTITYEDSDHRLQKANLTYKNEKEMLYKLNNIYNTAPGQNKISKEDFDKGMEMYHSKNKTNSAPSDEEIINSINEEHPDATPEEKKAMYDDVINSYQ